MAISSSTAPETPRLYDGDEANELVRQLALKRSRGAPDAGESVTLGVPYFDRENPPLMRGEVALFTGLTSHGKTLFASTFAKHTLERIDGRRDRALLVVMTEETIEARRVQTWGDSQVTLRSLLMGEADLERIDKNIVRSKGQQVFFIGMTTELEDVGTNNGIIRPSTVALGVHGMLQRGISPEAVLVDHAHDMVPDRAYSDEKSMHDGVAEELKQLANALSRFCPLVVLGQVIKEVERRPPQSAQPNAYDLKYMQALAARSRDVYTLYYPSRHHGNGISFPTVRGSVKAGKGTFLVYSAKARNGRCAGETLAMTALDDDGQWSNQLREAYVPAAHTYSSRADDWIG